MALSPMGNLRKKEEEDYPFITPQTSKQNRYLLEN